MKFLTPSFFIPMLALLIAGFPEIGKGESYSHEVKGASDRGEGYSSVTVKLFRPETLQDKHPRALILELPLCERRSVKRLDQYCATKEGVVGQVTSLTGKDVRFETPDLSKSRLFAQFLKLQHPGRTIASDSGVDSETVCQASCLRARAEPCSAKGTDLESAFLELDQYYNSHPPDCVQCDLRQVVCNGRLLPAEELQALRLKTHSRN